MNNPYAEQALVLLKRNMTPIPLTGKKPLIEGWQALRALKPEQIYDWERAGLFKNVGMVCGAASDNTVVIDFDGLQGYKLFCEKFPELAKTFTVATGSGKGMHVYLKVALLPDSKGFMGIPAAEGEPFNIEIKSDGKQVVIPPSVHPDTGKAYVKHINAPIVSIPDIATVLNWAQSLKPEEKREWQPPTSGDDFNPKVTGRVYDYFMAQEHKLKREWINCACPNAIQHKHGDSDWSFGYNTQKFFGHCYSCGDLLLKDILPLIGIDASALGGLFERSEPLKIATAKPAAAIGTALPVITDMAISVITRSSRLSNYLNQLIDMDLVPDNPPVPFPLRVMHEFGGLARVITPGKLIGIVGVSGGGKTSLLETMVDGWLCYNTPCLVWSPEWDADEFIMRAAQRYGGPSVDDVKLHQIYKQEVKQGIFKDGAGVAITRDKVQMAEDAIEILRGWTEEVGYLDMPFLTIGMLQAQIEATLKALTFKPRVLAIDYAQLLFALDNDRNMTMYNLLMRIKAVCRAYGLVGLVASQVTKASAREAQGGDILDGMSARYVNDDAFNLFITINPDRETTMKDMKKVYTGRFLPSAVLNITKTSEGRKGKIRVPAIWERLMFGDEKHHNQNFEGEIDNEEAETTF